MRMYSTANIGVTRQTFRSGATYDIFTAERRYREKSAYCVARIRNAPMLSA